MVPAFVVAVTSHIMPLLHHRRTLFSVFLAVPRPLLLRLAATGEEGAGDGDGSGVQADDGGGRKQDAQLAWSKPEKSIELDVRTKRRVALLVAPMVILIGAILGLHMVSYFRVQSTRDPLNNMVATEVREMGRLGVVCCVTCAALGACARPHGGLLSSHCRTRRRSSEFRRPAHLSL